MQVSLSWLVQVWEVDWQDVVKEQLTNSRRHDTWTLLVSEWLLCREWRRLDSNTRVQVHILVLEGRTRFVNILEDHPFTFTTSFFSCQVVVTDNHVLWWGHDRLTILRCQDVSSGKHQQTSFGLGFIWQRNVDGHLVTVKVGVISFSNQWVQTHCLTWNQDRLKRLNSQTVKRWCTVQKNWVLLDNVFQDVHNNFVTTVDHTLSGTNVTSQVTSNQFLHDEWAEQFHSHWTWQSHLVHLQERTNVDNWTSWVVNTLTKQVLTETSLLTLKHVWQWLQWTVTRTRYRTSATTVVNQRVDGFLQHTLFVLNDNARCVQLQQTLQTVVTVDNTTVQIVQVRRCKTSTFQLHHWTQVRWDNRNNIHNHPLWLVTRLNKSFDDVQTTNGANTLLTSGLTQFCLQRFNFSFKISICQQRLYSFSTHTRFKSVTVFGLQLTVLTFWQQLLLSQRCITGLSNHVWCEVDNLFQWTWWHIQDQSHTWWNSLEIPDVWYRSGQLNVTHTLTTDLWWRYFNATTVTNDSLVTNTLVLSASTFIILGRSKDTLVEKSILFWLERTIVDCLRLLNFTIRPAANLVWTSQSDLHAFKLIDINQWFDPFRRFLYTIQSSTSLCPCLLHSNPVKSSKHEPSEVLGWLTIYHKATKLNA